ncbi:MAG: HDIG domain-containing protein [Candidatus Aminicenantes bacterium]|nr:MAG: HDIG domain-containing protein [Candidatus Aminicenantes bacterium]
MIEALPSREECIGILKKSGCNKKVVRHCKKVEDLALRINELANGDKNLVSVAAMLHDIGRANTHGIRHAVEGAEMARELGLPESVILIIERHIGAGITKDEAKRLGLTVKDYVPITLEEKIVSHADNLIEETKKRPVREVIRRFEELGYENVGEKILKLHKELSEICGIDLDLI